MGGARLEVTQLPGYAVLKVATKFDGVNGGIAYNPLRVILRRRLKDLQVGWLDK